MGCHLPGYVDAFAKDGKIAWFANPSQALDGFSQITRIPTNAIACGDQRVLSSNVWIIVGMFGKIPLGGRIGGALEMSKGTARQMKEIWVWSSWT